jgi:hypothetical protein
MITRHPRCRQTEFEMLRVAGVLPKCFSRKGRARPSSLRSRSGCYGGVGPGAPSVFPVLCGGVGDPALPRNRLSRFGQHALKIRPQCLAIGSIVAILTFMPSCRNEQKKSMSNVCLNNLRLIASAIESWVLESGKNIGDTVDIAAVSDYMKGATLPVCPSGGKYDIPPVGKRPTCSIHGDLLEENGFEWLKWPPEMPSDPTYEGIRQPADGFAETFNVIVHKPPRPRGGAAGGPAGGLSADLTCPAG